jgi:hypothetical protein
MTYALAFRPAHSQYYIVFTTEDTSNVPSADCIFQGSDDELLREISVDVELVKRKLATLRVDKAPGVDDMSTRILRELHDEICQPVAS